MSHILYKQKKNKFSAINFPTILINKKVPGSKLDRFTFLQTVSLTIAAFLREHFKDAANFLTLLWVFGTHNSPQSPDIGRNSKPPDFWSVP